MVNPSRIDPEIAHYFAAPDVHDTHRERAPGLMPSYLLALLMTLLHGLNVYLLASGVTGVAVAVLLHLALTGLTAFIARATIGGGRDSRFLAVLLVTSAFTSVFGAAGTCLSIAVYALHARRAQSFAEWFSSMFPTRPQSAPEEIFEAILIGRDESSKNYSVIPFMEVLEAGSEAQKREALSKMMMNFDPRFSPAFRKALRDPSNTVRVQAATALTRIEHAFFNMLMRLTEAYNDNPGDNRLLLTLAKHYDDYSFTGILDPQREVKNRESALELYFEYLRKAPRDEEARVHIGRLLLRGGDPERAAQWLSECVQGGFRSDALMVWYVEALYASGRFRELRNVASRGIGFIEQFRAIHPQLAESLLLWTGRLTPPARGVA